LTNHLIKSVFLKAFNNSILSSLHDGAVFDIGNMRVAYSTDSYVVNPIFFPGGNIGELAVNGTVNDLAMCGADPLYLSVGFILEEGLIIEDLKRVVEGMERAARKAGVLIVTGDTKVVDRGKGDKIYINTSGIGLIPEGVDIKPQNVKIGDKIIINGKIAQHGISIMSVRQGMEFGTTVESDTAALNHLVKSVLSVTKNIHMMRDPTRGGLATALNEIAGAANVGILVNERSIPIDEEVKSACELLGFDPLYVANEGKMIIVVPASEVDIILDIMHHHELGKDAAVIGEVVDSHHGTVVMKTQIGGMRVVDMLSGEQLPRIC
ncbi:MAG: hydrogenase expression/formation protein HypE, partial [Candidatus Kryptoniota bacterium]